MLLTRTVIMLQRRTRARLEVARQREAARVRRRHEAAATLQHAYRNRRSSMERMWDALYLDALGVSRGGGSLDTGSDTDSDEEGGGGGGGGGDGGSTDGSRTDEDDTDGGDTGE